MTKRHLTIATRNSPLAMCQAELIKAQLLACHPMLRVDLLGLTTVADERLDVSLTEIGGKGLFVKELEEALLDERADIAVHSAKDMPMVLPRGLCLPVLAKREDPRDVFVSNVYTSLAALPQGAIVGTASLRRQAQLKALRPDVSIRILRGNIQTRLLKLDKADYDAIILAGAGLKRLQMSDRIRQYFSTEEFLPPAGQGALGIECREDDDAVHTLIAPLAHLPTAQCVLAERAVCRHLQGGCKVPVAAYAEIHHNTLKLRAMVAALDGIHILRAERRGHPEEAEQLGKRVAEELLQQGAEAILKLYR